MSHNFPTAEDSRYREAISSLEKTIDRLKRCRPEERAELQADILQLDEMHRKATAGRIEIVIFGEISTGKSALINALVGRAVAEVDVQGGWTKQVWGTTWEGSGYIVPGFDRSEIVLIDTPGINEIGGEVRAEMADTTARKADMILFVIDSDLNETEYASLLELAAIQKPIILVVNKSDLYTPAQLDNLINIVRERVHGVIPDDHIVITMADPRAIEYIKHRSDGSTQTEWKKPDPDVQTLKTLILEVLEREGLELIALNAAMYAADKSDKVSTLRVKMRNRRADQVIWSMASTKALIVAFSPGIVDVIAGISIDALMIVTLSKVYGLDFSMSQARGLAKAIFKAAGVFALGELTSYGASAVKFLTVHLGTPVTAIPQGAAAGFSSYIIGRAAKHYFEHGGSWGTDSPKTVVRRILDDTDRESVLDHLKDEIRKRLRWNRHAAPAS
ncbi:MAG TPA: GTP-binding protein [Pirellulaceae bacterium]|nr:GTP-binding protein [Pirellulaceae bacterium]HMO91737.1 GTP-binding protein [Pirellulaceae bacterium]HMP69800.1 GTP-binding protein [Pirellulaceae bacterium]